MKVEEYKEDSPLQILREMGLKGIEYRKMWNKLHADRMRSASKRWRESHPGKSQESLKRNRQKWRDNGGRKRCNARYYSGAEKAKFKGQAWDITDECLVLERSIPDKELAERLGRSVRAIQLKRCQLKKNET